MNRILASLLLVMFSQKAFSQEPAQAPAAPPSSEQPAQTPTPPVPPSGEKATESKSELKAVMIGNWFSPKMKLDLTGTTGLVSESGSFEYSGNSPFVIGFQWSQFSPNSWNHGFYVDYTKFEMNEVEITFPSLLGIGKISDSITLLGAGWALKYRWEQLYVPISLGIVSSNVSTNGSLTRTIKSYVNASVGVGFILNETVNFEIISRAVSIRSDNVTSGGVTFLAGTGTVSGLQLNALFKF